MHKYAFLTNCGVTMSFESKFHPDLDNLVKGIKDGCTKIIWHDDAQIVEMVVRKFYGMQPRAEVKIEVLCDSNKPE